MAKASIRMKYCTRLRFQRSFSEHLHLNSSSSASSTRDRKTSAGAQSQEIL
jgi:hypothetical protein